MPPGAPDAGLAALLLAGGRSTRMGRDKALLDWRGRPLWQAQLGKLAALGPRGIYVACREEQGLHHMPVEQVVTGWFFDPPADALGPMGAVCRVLRAVPPRPLLVLAVDMPRMDPAWLLERLAPAASADRGCFFQTRHGVEPLCGLYHPDMLPLLERRLADGRLALQGLAAECAAAGLADLRMTGEEEEALFHNMNRPEDLDA